MILLSKDYLIQEYHIKKRSTYEIAEACNTYANNIRRLLLKYGIPIRDKGEAQTEALRHGRHKHPTEGTKRSEKTKIKISERVARSWSVISDEERDKRIAIRKKNWDAMPEEQKEAFQKMALEAMRKAAEEGSKLEKYLLVELRRCGYNVQFHRTHLTINEQLQVDLFIPELKTAIEIDGPTHFFPIWGEENLAKHLTADHAKTGLLINSGYVVIRIKNLLKNFSKIHFRQALTNVLQLLQYIQDKFPDREHRLMEMEVSD